VPSSTSACASGSAPPRATAQLALRRREPTGLFGTLGADEQEAARADLARRSPEELAREFGQAEELLRGSGSTAEESLGLGASLVFGEARQLAGIARYTCKQSRTTFH